MSEAVPRKRPSDDPPLIAHVVHRFDVGGMENGVANLIDALPAEFARHCVIALTEVSASFARRVRRDDVRFVELRKPPGQTARVLPRLWRELRAMRPAIVHTRNVATLEAQLAAWAAGVPVRIHGEHGWDIGDLDGSNVKMLWLRRIIAPLVHHQVALSRATERYLRERVRVPADRISNICNGVDTDRFSPSPDRRAARNAVLPDWSDGFVIGAVGRVAAVKNLAMLLDSFSILRERDPEFARRARLAIVGDGPDIDAVREKITHLGLRKVTSMLGERDDVARCLQALDLLCLTSLAEGISNTILEAMATGIPVIATDVGGNCELVVPSVTGGLVRSNDSQALAVSIEQYFMNPALAEAHGRNARSRSVREFSIASMIQRYHRLYTGELQRTGRSSSDAILRPNSTDPLK